MQGLRLSLIASITATAATTPFAIAYFNRFSVYGLLSNLFEAPISAVVLPALAAGTVLSATPLRWPALWLAGAGLWLINKIAGVAAALPQAVITWSSAPAFVLPLATAGILWACLVRGRARWLGVIVATTIMWWPRVPAPDIWIDPEGGNAAIRTGNSAYALRPKRLYGFPVWTQHYGVTPLDQVARDRDYDCSGYACTPLPSARWRVGFWFSNKPPSNLALLTLCLNSDMVVLRNPIGDWPDACAGVNHISAGDFRRMGALELTRRGNGWAIKAAQPLRGHRYWSSPSDAEGSDSGY